MLMVGIGDSITWGYPYGPKHSWFNITADRVGFTAINAGVSGETTGEIHARFAEDVSSHKPDFVIIMGGTNDAFYGLSVELAVSYLDKMVNLAKDQGFEPILAVPPPLTDTKANYWLQLYRSLLISYADNLRLHIIDFFSISPELCDEVHPNQKGYQAMAELFELKLTEWRIR